jgi:hypothetical protein
MKINYAKGPNEAHKNNLSIGLGWKAGRRFTKPMAPENRQE